MKISDTAKKIIFYVVIASVISTILFLVTGGFFTFYMVKHVGRKERIEIYNKEVEKFNTVEKKKFSKLKFQAKLSNEKTTKVLSENTKVDKINDEARLGEEKVESYVPLKYSITNFQFLSHEKFDLKKKIEIDITLPNGSIRKISVNPFGRKSVKLYSQSNNAQHRYTQIKYVKKEWDGINRRWKLIKCEDLHGTTVSHTCTLNYIIKGICVTYDPTKGDLVQRNGQYGCFKGFDDIDLFKNGYTPAVYKFFKYEKPKNQNSDITTLQKNTEEYIEDEDFDEDVEEINEDDETNEDNTNEYSYSALGDIDVRDINDPYIKLHDSSNGSMNFGAEYSLQLTMTSIAFVGFLFVLLAVVSFFIVKEIKHKVEEKKEEQQLL